MIKPNVSSIQVVVRAGKLGQDKEPTVFVSSAMATVTYKVDGSQHTVATDLTVTELRLLDVLNNAIGQRITQELKEALDGRED